MDSGVFARRNVSRFVAAADSVPAAAATTLGTTADAAEILAAANGAGAAELFCSAVVRPPRGHNSHAATSASRHSGTTIFKRTFISTQILLLKFPHPDPLPSDGRGNSRPRRLFSKDRRTHSAARPAVGRKTILPLPSDGRGPG